ncbi:hypothetical protein Pla52o_20230 [Novipirellula galeiformis]|uniref:Uncharacterized protein n=1 Tax=Novipirellula galeiformis TaxID=2528004 RepID=A0A5C6CMS7_9BACT|nr:hypothetical protein [Novipirellula galeiformis]TWU24099.1 hypothetical protein Pla52o_20230 [Novipirellula galeiformis]
MSGPDDKALAALYHENNAFYGETLFAICVKVNDYKQNCGHSA